MPETPRSVRMAGISVQALGEAELLARMDQAIAHGMGGWVVTANVDILRIAAHDPAAQRLIESADVVVPDGAPLVWTSRVAGVPFPERVTGADLIWAMSRTVARRGGSIFVIGGPPGSAAACADALAAEYPGLTVAGALCPPFGFDRDPKAVQDIVAAVEAARPTLVLVGMGFPRQEYLIEKLRAVHPSAWYLGCGAAVNFAAGKVRRAPVWMQDHGLEWLHRLVMEPRRMWRRYIQHGIPFAMSLLASTALKRAFRPQALQGSRSWVELPPARIELDAVPVPVSMPAAEMLSATPRPGVSELVELKDLTVLPDPATVVAPLAD